MHARTPASVVLIAFTAVLPGCGRRAAPAARDSGFAEMQHRGAMAMGVDQYTSTHQFDILPGGGRIQLERDSDDSLGTAQIRAHLRLLLHAFQAGDFSTPEFVHMKEMPGTRVMADRRAKIAYTYRELPRGAELSMATTDSAALAAIHAFMEAQRSEHHASGADSTAMPGHPPR